VKDPYDVLGVARNASSDDIRAAYRKLAKKLHPDLNPGNKKSEELFKEVSLANDILADEDKRKKFDSGEIDATGAERPRQRYYKDYASEAAPGHPYENASGYADFAGADDVFAELFRRQAQQSARAHGPDLQYRLTIEFLEAINGAAKRLTLPDGGTLDVTIPAGIQEGQVMRLRGKGGAGGPQGEAGDALVSISVNPHRYFTRVGNDIHLELPVTLAEAFQGSRVKVPTPTGSVMLAVPKGSNTGTVMRLKGKGASAKGGHGDEIVRLKVMLPQAPNPELDAFLSTWNPGANYDPRKEMQS
jgi:DnaJ-class molecular chaperone